MCILTGKFTSRRKEKTSCMNGIWRKAKVEVTRNLILKEAKWSPSE